MNEKVCDALFTLIVASTIFNYIPHLVQMNFLGGPVGMQLVFYPLVSMMIYSMYCQISKKNIFVDYNLFKRYIIIYFAFMSISLIHGIYIYPYYQDILNGPLSQIEKLPKMVSILSNFGIIVNEKDLLFGWMGIRVVKSLILEVFYTFFGTYIIYSLYAKRPQQCFDIFCRGIFCALFFVFIYSIIELFYLAGNEIATDILIFVTPFIHAVLDTDWYPPLLWKNQLRSIFLEPSFFGNFAAVMLPVLWYKMESIAKKRYVFIYTFFVFLIFLTQARTALAIFLGELFLFGVISILNNKNKALKLICIVMLSNFIAFGASLFYINNLQVLNINPGNNIFKAQDYIDENVMSLNDENKRSNSARFALIASNIRIGNEHFVLGVGKDLSSAYVTDKFTEIERNNHEVKSWIQKQEKNGILKHNISPLNEYVGRFAETGLVGLFLFFLPFLYCVINLCKKMYSDNFSNIITNYVFIMIIGTLASIMNGTASLFYIPWIVLAMSFVVIKYF